MKKIGCKKVRNILIKEERNRMTYFASFLFILFFAFSQAMHAFVVRDIRVVGLKRISVGTVLNYLPVEVGESVEPKDTATIIRTLYDTGFFQNVSLDRQGDTLVVNVVERGTIGTVTVVGNKEIPKDKMKELLSQMNLVKGRVFQRSSLERLQKELKQAYNARGKYNARIETSVKDLTENRVAISIIISEGRVSRIREVRFAGHHDFEPSDLLSQMTLAPKSFVTWLNKKDQYSKPAMDASLEAVRSFYLDRGYLHFQILSSQVMLSPDKKDVFINVHISEGPQYRFSGYDIIGRTALPRKELDALITIKKGEVFSRKKITESISAMGLRLGDEGYGFPAISAEPRIDEKNKTVFITFVVDPGRPVYVRRINFHGNVKTADYVLRNVIRQDEAALLSLHNIKESERQLRLLTYLKNINIATTPVPGANNQVDLDIQVEEAPSAEANASVGYGTNGPQVHAAFNQRNFMGTGRAVGLSFNASYWGQEYSFNYYNPFYTDTGMGRGLNLYYQAFDPKRLDVAQYSADKAGGDLNYNLPIGENVSIQFGMGYQNLEIKSVGVVQQVQNFVNLYGRNFNELRFTNGWNRNSYDQLPFPHIGMNQQFTALAAVPADDDALSYYKLSYAMRFYRPLLGGFIFSALGNVAYGDGFYEQSLPFFENYYAGGIAQPAGQVRGFESYSLGPRDIYGNAIGANFLTNVSGAIIFPYPISRDNIRTSVFVDAGNVFAFGVPEPLTGTDAGPLRYSVGVGLEWRSPFGPLVFSLAKPLNMQPGDRQQYFQFSLASGF